ncbi:MAG: ribonuclease PH [Zetaproteobacteria bacterium]|nr:ribonuclease PH [Zetaproteobacteria bacterium]
MSVRRDGRTYAQARPIQFEPDFTDAALASVLVSYGKTRVLCTISVEDSVPYWRRQQNPGMGWFTSEYALLPGSTEQRTRRERPAPSGRTQEIQRLISRSLRGVLNFKAFPDKTIYLDCDVIRADGGTRTAAISGGYVALAIACKRLLQKKKINSNPIQDGVHAMSLGILAGQVYVDLDYSEDSRADTDFNVVSTYSGKLLEIQGTAEEAPFSRTELNAMLDAVEPCFEQIKELQQQAITKATT